jgi:hypothetical protein
MKAERADSCAGFPNRAALVYPWHWETSKMKRLLRKKARDISTALEVSLRETSTGSRLEPLDSIGKFCTDSRSGVRVGSVSMNMSDDGVPAWPSNKGNCVVAFPACFGS